MKKYCLRYEIFFANFYIGSVVTNMTRHGCRQATQESFELLIYFHKASIKCCCSSFYRHSYRTLASRLETTPTTSPSSLRIFPLFPLLSCIATIHIYLEFLLPRIKFIFPRLQLPSNIYYLVRLVSLDAESYCSSKIKLRDKELLSGILVY